MARKRTDMSKIKDILRLRFDAGLSLRDISKCCSVGPATVSEILSRFATSGLSWPLLGETSETELEKAVYKGKNSSRHKRQPDFALMHQELKRKGMTKLLLWQEYRDIDTATAYGYTQFCEHYQTWVKSLKRSMRQLHIAGDKLFIDYCGPTVAILNPDTGEIRYHAQIFVATLGASNYTYVEAGRSQQLEDWIMAHARAFAFFGGIPRLLVPDNLRSAVSKTHRYMPVLNENYARMARHYGTAVMPARPYKPKDKSKAENAVLIVERWILMRLRHEHFYTLSSLNLRIRELLQELNHRQQRVHPGSRHELYVRFDKLALMPLPLYPYEYIDSKQARVGPDYHVLYAKHAYSVPHHLVSHTVTIEATAQIICVYYQGKVVAQHPRKHHDGGFTTVKEHMPDAHIKQRWSAERLMGWADNIGRGVRAVITFQLERRQHPEQAVKSCLAILSLAKKYSNERLEAASQQALLLEQPYLKVITNLLVNNKEHGSIVSVVDEQPPLTHHNIRGQHYYQ